MPRLILRNATMTTLVVVVRVVVHDLRVTNTLSENRGWHGSRINSCAIRGAATGRGSVVAGVAAGCGGHARGIVIVSRAAAGVA